MTRIKYLIIMVVGLSWNSLCFAEEYKVLTENLAPVHYEENGTVKGIATEIVLEIFKEAGMQPNFSVYPWKRAYHMTLNNKNTFIYTINRTENRESLFRWIGPILSKKTFL
ncbi:MAG: transporter substrate-binding domain-containing protein, partial [Bacteroidetes bacterium]|nr:transporter substrate-binding domain-containing protein [Bacteroidota bacterium]